MPRRHAPRPISPVTVTRRRFLEWSGQTTVLALGAGLLARCRAGAGGDPDGTVPDAGPDAAPVDAGPDATTAPLCAEPPATFPFQPGDLDAAFPSWNERTVDRQDLEALLASWRLTVDGLVDTPRSLAFADLLCLPRQDQVTDFHCVEGWSVQDVPWNGVHLSQLLAAVGPQAGATHVTFHTVGGRYNESLPLAVALEPRTLLAYGAADQTLPLKHGFPLRVVIPRLLGYKNAKYVQRIELTDHPVLGFWVNAGYPYDGLVPESRLRPGKY